VEKLAVSYQFPLYFGIKAVSNTDVSFYVSIGGMIWAPLLLNYNPGLTLGSVGPALMSHAAAGVSAAWEFLRVWNTAKTFPV
jgi:hypothetical protein